MIAYEWLEANNFINNFEYIRESRHNSNAT